LVTCFPVSAPSAQNLPPMLALRVINIQKLQTHSARCAVSHHGLHLQCSAGLLFIQPEMHFEFGPNRHRQIFGNDADTHRAHISEVARPKLAIRTKQHPPAFRTARLPSSFS
jgi:hypothetical protein